MLDFKVIGIDTVGKWYIRKTLFEGSLILGKTYVSSEGGVGGGFGGGGEGGWRMPLFSVLLVDKYGHPWNSCFYAFLCTQRHMFSNLIRVT